MPADLFEAGTTHPGVDRGALHPEPYLCWEINSQLIKIRALEKCPELELHWPPSQSKPVVLTGLWGCKELDTADTHRKMLKFGGVYIYHLLDGKES